MVECYVFVFLFIIIAFVEERNTAKFMGRILDTVII